MKRRNLSFLHAGHRRDESTTSVAVPIYQTTSYQFNNTDHAAKALLLTRAWKYIY
ncbi:MAG: PLP-dependent transferase [Alphaproteobacteria bacterium]